MKIDRSVLELILEDLYHYSPVMMRVIDNYIRVNDDNLISDLEKLPMKNYTIWLNIYMGGGKIEMIITTLIICILIICIFWHAYIIWKLKKEHHLMAKELKKSKEANKELERKLRNAQTEYNKLTKIIENYLGQ